MAFFPFSGWKESFFGDMYAQGRDAIEFYTEKKVVVERWPREWSRNFSRQDGRQPVEVHESCLPPAFYMSGIQF
jgi:hypothetical protein